MNRKSNLTSPCALACLAALAIVAGPAHATPATIANFSFQSNVNPDATGRFAFGESRDFGANGATDTVQAGDENNITGWTTVTTENTNVNGAELAVGFINITPADGTQVLSLQSGSSTKQFTTTAWSSLAVGDQITMTVAIGDRNSINTTWADESFFALIDGSTSGTLAAGTLLSGTVANSGVLATPFTGGLGIDGGTMQDRTFTHTVVAADLLRSGNVGILLAAYGTATDATGGLAASANQAFFDNVRLDITTGGSVLKINSITKSGSTVTIGFTGVDGLTYRLNKSTTLDFTTPDIKDTVTLTGSTTGTLEDNTASENAAFYRVEKP